jgi:hypothetical protein
MEESRELAWRPQLASVAAAENPDQTNRYPDRNTPVGT